jgi:hypothetical protein
MESRNSVWIIASLCLAWLRSSYVSSRSLDSLA